MSKVKNVFKSPTRAISAVATGGFSEAWRKTNPAIARAQEIGDGFFRGPQNLPAMQGGQSATELLANTGGAPVLSNIVLGVSPEEALAGFFGKNTKDGSWQQFLGTLSQSDFDSVNSTLGQLKSIQDNRQLRDQAVQKVIDDYPNLVSQVAQARAKSGEEFDQVTQGYMKLALDQTAAKYAAGGNISSGAANEAFSRVGAEQGMNKLNYMGEREANAYNQLAQGFNMRLSEVNALRDFQNTMLQQKASEGFSANQANLGRLQQTQMANFDASNQRYLMDQQSKNAMLGSLGSLAGTYIGAKTMGLSMLGNSASNSTASPKPTYKISSYDNYTRNV